MPENRVVGEIGVHEGHFSRRILSLTDPTRLHLIDPWECRQDLEHSWYGRSVGQNEMDDRYHNVKLQFRMRKEVYIHRKRSDEVSFPPKYFDWVYIDGDHTYDAVKADLIRFAPMITEGGFLCGDDYGVKGWWEDGVTKAVNELYPDALIIGTQFIISL